MRSSRRDIIILGALALLVLAPGATSGSLADWDEAIYAEVALQYHLTGDWLHPSWNGAPWYHKPPLAMWLTAAAYALAGVGEGTARLFSVLCGIGGVLATYGIARSTLGRPVALISALILLSTPHYFLFGKLAMLDAPLTCFLTLGFLAYWRAQSDPRWLLAAGAAFATALMIKGAAAVIGPLAVTLHASLHRPSQLIGSRWLWLGLAVGLGIALPWHLYQHIEVGAAFWDQYFFYHTLLRTREAIEGHTGGPAYYLEVLVRRQRPWFLLALPAVLYCVFVARRERSKQLSLFLCWITAVVGAVMTVQTRIAWYLLPIYPALSICTAFALLRWIPERRLTALTTACLLVLVGQSIVSDNFFRADESPEGKALGSHVRAHLSADQRLHLYQVAPPAALFYGRHPVVSLSQDQFESRLAAPDGSSFVLTRQSVVSQAKAAGSLLDVVAQAGDQVLMRLGRPQDR